MNSYGLIVAMEPEARNALEAIGEVVGETYYGMIKVTEMTCSDQRLFLAWSGVGEIAAAVATSLLINKLGVEGIINYGLVGAISDKCKPGELLLASEIVHYDYTMNVADKSCEGKYWFNKDSYVNQVDSGFWDVDSLHLQVVRLATGDKFINDNAFRDYIAVKFGADVVDMESMGVWMTCMMTKTPCVIIKAVSDNADKDAVAVFYDALNRANVNFAEAVKLLINSRL